MIVKNFNDLSSEHIKNIIFDWGGVIINIDYLATTKAFNKLSDKDFNDYYNQSNQQDLFSKLEVGNISSEVFHAEIQKEFGAGISTEEINSAWCAMLLDTPKERIDTLKRLKDNYRIFLLSNTNIIHENIIVDKLNQELGFEFFSLFENSYLSHRIGMRKPNSDIFKHVIRENNLNASETLFIDDSEQHIKGAAKTELIAFHLLPGLQIQDLFKNWMKNY